MINKIKQNLIYFFNAGLGALAFILYAFPYAVVKASRTRTFSGYRIMGRLWSIGFEGPFCALIQILVLLLGISMLVYGAFGILKAFGIFTVLPDKIGKLNAKKLGFLALLGYAGLNVILLVSTLFLCFENLIFDHVKRFAPHVGSFITILIACGAVVAYKILEDKFAVGEDYVEEEYRCSKCNRRVRKSVKFCSKCGGEIIRLENVIKAGKRIDYFCSSCFKSAKKNDAFCPDCGGKIVSSASENQDSGAPAFDVVITAAGENIFLTVKALRMATNIGLQEAKERIESAPATVAEGVNEAVAKRIEKYLTEAGAAVEIIELGKSEEPAAGEPKAE